MRHLRWLAIVAAVVAIALVGAACGGDDAEPAGGGALSGDIRIDGSSTVGPLTEAAAEFFQEENPDVRVTVGISGTGGGFEKFCAGETDVNDASRQIEPDEEQLCADAGVEYVEIQVAERRACGRREPGERLGRQPHGGAATDDLGRGQHDRQLEPGRSELPRRVLWSSSAPARTRARSTTSPKPSTVRRASAGPTTRPPRTTTSRSRAWRARRAAWRTSASPTTSRTPKGQARGDRQRERAGDPVRRDRAVRRVHAAQQAALHLPVGRGAAAAGSGGVHQVLPRQRRQHRRTGPVRADHGGADGGRADRARRGSSAAASPSAE